MALAQAGVAAVTAGRQRQNKNERLGRPGAWREMGASARTAVLVRTALPEAPARGKLQAKDGVRDRATAPDLEAQTLPAHWHPQSPGQSDSWQRGEPRLNAAQIFKGSG